MKNGEIVLNVSYDATHRLTIGNDLIQFSARFSGVSRECSIPIESVLGIFARENGQGLFFAEGQSADTPAAGQGNGTASGQGTAPASPNGGKPKLQIVK